MCIRLIETKWQARFYGDLILFFQNFQNYITIPAKYNISCRLFLVGFRVVVLEIALSKYVVFVKRPGTKILSRNKYPRRSVPAGTNLLGYARRFVPAGTNLLAERISCYSGHFRTRYFFSENLLKHLEKRGILESLVSFEDPITQWQYSQRNFEGFCIAKRSQLYWNLRCFNSKHLSIF